MSNNKDEEFKDQVKRQKIFERLLKKTIRLYELDQLLTSNDREKLETTYLQMTVTSSMLSGFISVIPTYFISEERSKKWFKINSPSKSLVLGTKLIVLCSTIAMVEPFTNFIANKIFLWRLKKGGNTRCVDIIEQIGNQDPSKWYRYYQLTKEHPEKGLTDPRLISKEEEEMIKKTFK